MSLVALQAHPAVQRLETRRLTAREARSQSPQHELVIWWVDQRLNAKSYFVWPTLGEAVASGMRAAMSRAAVLRERFGSGRA